MLQHVSPKFFPITGKIILNMQGQPAALLTSMAILSAADRIFNIAEKDEGQYDNQADVFWSSGACMIVRADAWKKCGGFDADFFAHMEEIDLCWRFNKAGFRYGFYSRNQLSIISEEDPLPMTLLLKYISISGTAFSCFIKTCR